MYPYISIFGKNISSYAVLAIAGVIAAAIYAAVLSYKKKINGDDAMYYLTFAFGFLMIGAMVLYQLVNVRNTVSLLPYLFKDFKYFINNWTVGFVFYGGMYGVLVGGIVYSAFFKQDIRKMFMLLTPVFVLFHAFGRVGCFLSGCCYGMESEAYGIVYHDAISGANGVPYLPVQLYEAAGNLVIFAVILIFGYRKKDCYFRPLGIYLVLYGIMRFVLEFFRGDEIRGALGVFSTSQWISLVTVPLGIYMLLCPTEKNLLGKAYNQVVISKQ